MKKYYDNDMIDEIYYIAQKGDLQRALDMLEDYRLRFPLDKMANITYADLLSKLKRYDEAEEELSRIINDKLRNDKLKAKALSVLADVCAAQKRIEEAKCFRLEAFELSGRKQFYQFRLLCDLYVVDCDFDSAKNLIERYKDEDNEDYMNLILADVLLSETKYYKALYVLKDIKDYKFEELDKQRYQYLLGKAYYFTKEYDEALKHLKNAMSLKNGTYWSSMYYIACIRATKGNVDGAITLCEEILYSGQKTAGVYDMLSNLYLKKQDSNKSIELIKDIDDQGRKLYNEAKYLLQQGDFLSAEKIAYKALLEADNLTKGRIKYVLVLAKFKQRKYDEVMEIIDDIENVSEDIKMDLLRVKYYINHINGNDFKSTSYTAMQINDYQESMALAHIYARHSLDFNPEIDITNLFYSIQDGLENNIQDNLKSFDTYRVPVKDVGCKDINYTSVLKVVCIPNSTKILTMFPDSTMEKIKDDLNIEEENKNVKKKTLSQIEKFNKRYNLS